MSAPQVLIIGGGPAGLMAAEVLAGYGYPVELLEAMPTAGRKFLQAGVGGLNITHAEPLAGFIPRYGAQAGILQPMIEAFPPAAIRDWIHGLGIETFTGSSGRVFPREMKAAPLLRAWLRRLQLLGVEIRTRQRWLGWTEQGALLFRGPEGCYQRRPAATLLALGGGSWPKLGSDAAWLPWLQGRGVQVAPLRPANCGFEVPGWSPLLRERFAGAPLKSVALGLDGVFRKGEFILTGQGVEGSLIYALSAPVRQRIEQAGQAVLQLDLFPDRPSGALAHVLARPRGRQSLASHLRRQLGLEGVRAALLRELAPAGCWQDSGQLAAACKALPLTLVRPRPLAEAISSAGGVCFPALDGRLMLQAVPGIFCAGEMLDWEAPTGGYLLTACLATGRAAAEGIRHWLSADPGSEHS